MLTCNDLTSTPIAPAQLYFKVLMGHLGWKHIRSIYAQGFNTKKEIKGSIYANEAYKLGFDL